MKLKLPKDWSTVTVGQFIDLLPSTTNSMSETQQTAHVLSVLSGVDKAEIYKMSLDDIAKHNKRLEFLSKPLPQGKHKKRFKLLGVWYEVDPNAKKLSGGQYIRTMQILKDLAEDPDTIDKNIHLILANVIKPMKRKGLKLEALTEYDIADLSKTFLRCFTRYYCLPYHCFFLQSLESLNSLYGGLFSTEDKDDTRGIGLNKKGFTEQFGWYITLDNLSNSRPETWEYYMNISVIELLNLCAYYKSKAKVEERKQRLASMKK